MKYLLFLLTGFMSLSTHANDTLTFAQVYNFNIGDTFDYRNSQWSNDADYVSFERDVVVNKWADTNTGMLHIALYITKQMYNQAYFDTLTINNPQQYALYWDTTITGATQFTYSIDSNSVFNGKILNGFYDQEFEGATETIYGDGLGEVLNVFYIGATNDPGSPAADSTLLIYYSKGAEKWGTPYYVADGQPIIHFSPLPEECATWTYVLDNGGYTQQLRTGNKVPFNGYSYIELIARGEFTYNQALVPDTLIAYFRNDTVNQEYLFYNTLSDSAFFIYDLKQIANGGNCNAVDQININGQLHTRWNYGYETGSDGGYPILRYAQYAEGIGGLNGPFFPHPFLGDVNNSSFGQLSCLSVCGQMIYPSDTSPLCPTITAIEQVTETPVTVNLFPTVNDGKFEVAVSITGILKLAVFDVLGKQILSQPLNSSISTITLSHASAGIYFWQVLSSQNTVQTGRFVVGTGR